MIRHIVLTKFKQKTSEAQIAEIYDGLASVSVRLAGAQNFIGGRSQSPEKIERGYMHGFTIDFESWEALQDYAENPEHRALGAQLIANSVGGMDGILVLDMEV